jgi:hypothetical protein
MGALGCCGIAQSPERSVSGVPIDGRDAVDGHELIPALLV